MPLPPLSGGIQFSRGISLAELTRLVLEDVLKKPFVLPPQLLAATQQVAVSNARFSPSTAEAVLSRVLRDNGFELQPGPVYYVAVIPPAVKKDPEKPLNDWLSYRPKHRPVSYFASALPQVFPDAKFSFDKAAKGAPGSGEQAGLDVFFANIEPKQRPELLRLIESLDVPVPRVVIRALLLEVSSDSRAGGGVKLAASALAGRLGVSIDAAPAGSAFTLHTGSVDLALTAFDGDSRFKTLSFPVLNVEHAQAGRFQVGSQIPIATSTTQDGVTTRTTEFRDVGTIMNVVPQVVGDSISVSVQLELSDVASTSTGTTTAPTILTRNLSTQTTLRSGSAVLLGNLQSSREGSSTGKLFGFKLNSDRSNTSGELVLMLYAEVVPLTQGVGVADGAAAPDRDARPLAGRSPSL